MTPKHALMMFTAVAAAVLAWFAADALLANGDRHGMRDEPLFAAPAFAYPDQSGQTVTTQSLRGQPWVANFIYTTCRTFCPLLTAKMVQLQRKLDGVPMRFVSFSVDPEHDTPEVMKAYARRWRPDDSRWLLLSTGEQTLPVTVQGFHVPLLKNDGGTPGDTVLHTNAFLLVDGEGMVRGVYDSESPDEFARLAGDARALAKVEPRQATTTTDGEALYHDLSCAGCHERAELAPALRGLNGKRRDVGNGLLITADADYVRESIVAPDAKRVSGYTVRMPTYSGLLAPAQLDALVAWVLARPEDPNAQEAAAKLETDPVCGMAVRAAPDSIRLEHAGHTYYFCSPGCRERFEQHPEAYVK